MSERIISISLGRHTLRFWTWFYACCAGDESAKRTEDFLEWLASSPGVVDEVPALIARAFDSAADASSVMKTLGDLLRQLADGDERYRNVDWPVAAEVVLDSAGKWAPTWE